MGTTSENFCLRWNNFATNVSGSLGDLREDSDFFDVTLSTSDSGNRTLQAHKVILSACSDFFKQMLRQQTRLHSHNTPLAIYLRGVGYQDLLSALDFMYHGEVNVAQADLNSFLAVAEELQIKGLTNSSEQSALASAASSNEVRTPMASKKRTGPPLKRIRRSSPMRSQTAGTFVATVIGEDGTTKEVNMKIDAEAFEDAADVGSPPNSNEVSYTKFYGDAGSRDLNATNDGQAETSEGTEDVSFSSIKEEIVIEGSSLEVSVTSETSSTLRIENYDAERQLENMLLLEGESWVCRACGRSGKRRDNMKRHVENKHLPRVLRCKLCRMLVRNRQSFYRHMKHQHGITSMRETEQYKEDPCDPSTTSEMDSSGNPVGSYDDEEYEEAPGVNQILG